MQVMLFTENGPRTGGASSKKDQKGKGRGGIKGQKKAQKEKRDPIKRVKGGIKKPSKVSMNSLPMKNTSSECGRLGGRTTKRVKIKKFLGGGASILKKIIGGLIRIGTEER